VMGANHKVQIGRASHKYHQQHSLIAKPSILTPNLQAPDKFFDIDPNDFCSA
jgi:hypothetical protein